MLVTQEKNYPSIFIQETVDLTLTVAPNEKGVVGMIGALTIGNPYTPRVLTSATEPLKSTIVNNGGLASNEVAHQISDFFSGFNGKMQIARVLGVDSTTKVIEVVKNVAVYEISDATAINIFGANNIVDWDNTAVTSLMEIVIKACPTEKVTLSIVNELDLITVTLYDANGNTIYTITGGASYDSVDDFGDSNYIGNITDANIISIKVDTTHLDYVSTFSITKEYTTGLVIDTGLANYANALSVISSVVEKCDYLLTGGLSDVASVQALRTLAFTAKIPFFVDIYGADKTSAITYKNSLSLDVSGCHFTWNRSINKFRAGNLKIGLSGFMAGRSIARNLSRLVRNVEFRVEGIAGVDYPVSRTIYGGLATLSDADKTELTKNRINTVIEVDDKLTISDVLSGEAKNTSLRLFPVSEGKLFIEREIARIMQVKLFKNLGQAKAFIKKETDALFDRCQKNLYFDNDAEIPYKVDYSDSNNDTITVSYIYVPEGLFRRGVVKGTLTQKIS